MIKERPAYSNLQFAKDLWYFFKVRKGEFILLTVLIAISSALGLLIPILLAKIIDFFTKGGGEIKTFYYLLGAILGITIVNTFLRLGSKHYFMLFINKIQKSVKVDSFQKLMAGDLAWHDKENTGNKMEKINSGTRALGDFVNFYANSGIDMVISLVGIVIVFIYFDIKYALIAFLFIFIYMFLEFKLNKRFAERSLILRIEGEKSSGKAYEFSSNIRTIKSLGMESKSHKQILNQEEIVLQAKKKRREASTIKWISIQLVAVMFYAIFIFFVGKDVWSGALTIGSIVIYISYVDKIQGLLNRISRETDGLIETKYGIFRLMEIYHLVPEINEEGAKPLKDWGEIKVDSLSFRYRDEAVLEDFSLNIKKGEKIGIVGKSGSGKSTFFKLLLKLYLPYQGMIYFDGKPITSLKRDSILNKISIVPQETEVFNLPLRENVTISGNGLVIKQMYEKAIEVSQVSDFIPKLSQRDKTLIGEKGVRLSGGERQRLGIARAIYKNCDIIIFDEATSNLDYATEVKIQKALNKLKDKTLILSAHRLSTLQNMDKILVMDKGRIIEQGNYDELLKKKGYFYQLWKKQGAWKD